ncbi:MAG: tetratricopeptide repeat protein, partial [Bacteroidales bacterium]|nr:tetratricopeptide repeat protein [Bacteroidales bacterium]
SKPGKRGIKISDIVIAVLLIAVIVLIYPKIFKPDKLEQLRKKGEISIAVMPFQNMTGDTTWNIWQEGIQNELITSLTNTQELKVRQTETVNNFLRGKDHVNYASLTPSLASDISQKLDVNIFIYGTIKQAGENIRLNAQLVDSKTDEIIRSFEINAQAKEEMIFDVIDSLNKNVRDFLVINKLMSGTIHQTYYYDYLYSKSPEAYRYFIYGHKAFSARDYPRARDWFHQSLEADSGFVLPASYMSVSYGNQGLYEEAKKWCLKIYSKKDLMPVKLKLTLEWLYANYFETPEKQIRYLKQALEIDEKLTVQRYLLGICYNQTYQYDKAITEFEKLFEIYDKTGLEAQWAFSYTAFGLAYHESGEYRREKKLYKKAEKDFPDDYLLLYRQSVLALSMGKTKAADEYIDRYISALEERSYSEAAIAYSLGRIYLRAGMLEKAEKYYRQALSLQPEGPARMNNLAYILIDNEINIEEGLELAGKALESEPDNYLYLHTKGWGLYKQGNYEEALKYLERSWELKPIYDHDVFLHLEAARKALASNYNNNSNSHSNTCG